MLMRASAIVLASLLLASVASESASAQEAEAAPVEQAPTPNVAPAPEEIKPWNIGVSEEDKALAQPLFDAGNEFFKRSNYGNALGKYREAIAHRDHPAIRFNMAVCLVNLGQFVEAHENLVAGLRYGPGPLGNDLFSEGQTYMKLLLAQLAELKVTTLETNAKVSLNGEHLFDGPGEATRMVRPKVHQIIATKDKMVTVSLEVVPTPGEANVVNVEMHPFTEEIVLERRWAPWKPWAVVGGGLGLALLGVPLQLNSRAEAQRYDQAIARECPQGCSEDKYDTELSDLSDLRTRAERQEIAAFSLFFVGGAVVTTGVVMAFFNRPEARRLERDPTRIGPQSLSFAPSAEGGGVFSFAGAF